jgi:methyl-galactoside transport system permease protein
MENDQADYQGKTDPQSKKDLKEELATAKYEIRSSMYDARSRAGSHINRAKANMYQASVDRVQKNRALRNGKTNYHEDQMLKRKAYAQNFRCRSFCWTMGLSGHSGLLHRLHYHRPDEGGNGNLFSLPNILDDS